MSLNLYNILTSILGCIILLPRLCFMYNISSIVFIILSQPNSYHDTIAAEKKISITNQYKMLNIETPVIHIISGDVPNIPGYWTVIPIINWLRNRHGLSWVFVLDEITEINVKNLDILLSTYNFSKDYFLGHALKDEEPTIIHHFDSVDDSESVLYPDFYAGFLVSSALLKKISSASHRIKDVQFSIDAKYELAKVILEHGNTTLTHVNELCLLERKYHCASWIPYIFPKCNKHVSDDSIFFAVKTYHKHHGDRVQVVKNTWAKDAEHLVFFSDVSDKAIPSHDIGIKNVPAGHCQKTLSIIDFVNTKHSQFQWLIIADDDTLISVNRLTSLLSCYNASEYIALGERYGYATHDNGYDYLTGGAGMVFSMPVVKKLADDCNCPSIDSPDDMILGLCLKWFDIPIIHSAHFHQARPNDYSTHYLQHHTAISFHKHWMIDPYEVYKTWLLEEPKHSHVEL